MFYWQDFRRILFSPYHKSSAQSMAELVVFLAALSRDHSRMLKESKGVSNHPLFCILASPPQDILQTHWNIRKR